MFSLTGHIFNYRNVELDVPTPIGIVTYDDSEVLDLLQASYDSDADENFFMAKMSDGWVLYTNIGEASSESMVFDVPIYFEYVDSDGLRTEVSETFTIYGVSESRLYVPSIKYIENLATRINTSAEVVIHGRYFDENMDVFIRNGSFCAKVPHDETYLRHGNDAGTDDTISFVMQPEYALSDANGEICAVYEIGLGMGECKSNTIMTLPVEFENNIGLIRYKYDSANSDATKIASAGALPSTNKACYYTSEVKLVYDTADNIGGYTADGGASGKYGDTMYVRLGPGQDCSKMRYFRVKLKYNRRLDRLFGEQVLDGVKLEEGDVVWLAAQMDDTEGLWIVSEGEWVGMKTYLSEIESYVDYETPCASTPQEPLPVDYTVFPDLGANVADTVTAACADDVPVKHGSQMVCGTMRSPGDILVLDNQVDGMNGIWEVTCADWVYRGLAGDHSGTTINQSDAILVQNDIDFCKCGTYHIWYYYLNGGCYLATATRTVKVICSGASIVPNNNVVITDYSVRTGTDDELVSNVIGTAGDPVPEDCAVRRDEDAADNGTYNAQNNVGTVENSSGCGPGSPVLKAPNCMRICDCPRYYTVKFTPEYSSSKSSNGFSILFWQHGYEGWHLYAYIGAGNNSTGMNYYVYHLHCAGMASVTDVDVNQDIEYRIKNKDGINGTERTRDAWFVEHGGVLADGFGIVDDSWNFFETDEYGDRVMRYKHILDADSLYQQWSLGCTSILLATRDYLEPPTKTNRRVTCADMEDPVKSAECAKYIHGMEHVFGFKYYRSVLSLERFCDIYNDYTCVIGDTWSALSTDDYIDAETGSRVRAVIVTDQCYDRDGNECDCDAPGAEHGIIEA